MINIKKELVIFLILFIVSSLLIHSSEWFSIPLEHLEALFSHPIPYHPLLYVFLIYIVVIFLRGIFTLIRKIFIRK